jgi:uncharacterized protein
MFTIKQEEELIDLLCTLDSNTKVYIGTDSTRFKKLGQWYARYATVLVVHLNGRNGCRVFRNITVEPDYDMKKNRPALRLMNEVMKSCELYLQVAPLVDSHNIEIHCDVNTNEKHGSSCVASQAAGYTLAMTGLPEEQIKLKPDAWAASFGADHYAK